MCIIYIYIYIYICGYMLQCIYVYGQAKMYMFTFHRSGNKRCI